MEKTTTTTTSSDKPWRKLTTLIEILLSIFLRPYQRFITLSPSLNPQPLPTLPFDLVAEILCMLPIKLLLQLRCLCKSFNTLISDPKFAKKHFCMSTKRHHLILTTRDSLKVTSYSLHSIFNSVTIKPTQLRFPFTLQHHSIVGSCNGILCFVVNGYLILWNPTIRKFKKLPSMEIPVQSYYSSEYGFGYDHLIDNYKVVAIFRYVYGNGVRKLKIKVHTLGTNSWRMIEGDFPDLFGFSLKFVSGALNWLAYSTSDHAYNLVSFDLVNESYRKLLPPNSGGEDLKYVSLDVLKDCLCIFASSDGFSSVWLMKEYGNEDSWIKLYRVSYMEDPFCHFNTKPIWISDDDQVLLASRSSWNSKMYYAVYRFKNGTYKIPMTRNIDDWITREIYVESLISPCF